MTTAEWVLMVVTMMLNVHDEDDNHRISKNVARILLAVIRTLNPTWKAKLPINIYNLKGIKGNSYPKLW